MNLRLKLILLSLTALIFFSACSRIGSDTQTVNKSIVKINGNIYTTADLWDFSNIVLWEMEPKDLDNTKLRDKLLNDFIEHKLLFQEAEYRKINADSDMLNRFLAQLRSTNGSKELKALTGHYYINSQKVAKISEERMVVDKMLRQLADSSSYVLEGELRQYYDAKKKPTPSVEKEAHILHIFVKDNVSAHLAAKELAGGILFTEVARKYSEGPEKNNGGDLGFVKESSYPEFFSEAFRLKEGDVSEIITSEYGFHIFKMLEYAHDDRYSYDSIKTKILAELYTQKKQEIITEYVNVLYSNADIQYLNNFTLYELFPAEERRRDN
ncbi:MAG: peptidylprolyl isomerase [Deferribacteraceae bacterium]|jgi:parvulin-like peptidyl-prolyl isomerase|nr:peptidylprolyl isomerase [Deferribacteraceae bacterium]